MTGLKKPVMPAQPVLTEQEYEALSAYLDDMLDTAERAELESRLENEPLLRAELDTLQQTVTLIRELPPIKAPRDFRLTPEMVAANRPRLQFIPQRYSAQWLSAAAAVLVLAIGGLLAVTFLNPSGEPAPLEVAVLPTDTSTSPKPTAAIAFEETSVVRSEMATEDAAASSSDPLQSLDESFDFDFGSAAPPPIVIAPDETEKRIGSKTFVLEDDVWIDQDYVADTMQPEAITREGADNAALLEQEPLVADYAELGERVIFVLNDQAYRLGPE